MKEITTVALPSFCFQCGSPLAAAREPARIANVSTTSSTFSSPGRPESDHDASIAISSCELEQNDARALRQMHISTAAARKFLFANGKNPEELERKFSQGNQAACISLNNKAILLAELYYNAGTNEKRKEICSIAKDLCHFIAKHKLNQRSAFVLWTPDNDAGAMEKLTKRILGHFLDGNGDGSFPRMLENVFKRNSLLWASAASIQNGEVPSSGMMHTAENSDGNISSTALTEFNKIRDAMVRFVENDKVLRAPRENAMVTAWSYVHSFSAPVKIVKATGPTGSPLREETRSIGGFLQPDQLTPSESPEDLRKNEVSYTSSIGIDSEGKKKPSYPYSLGEAENVTISDSVSESASADTVISRMSPLLSVMNPDIMHSEIESRNPPLFSSKEKSGGVTIHADDDSAVMSGSLSFSRVDGEMNDDNVVVPVRGLNDISRIESEPFSHFQVSSQLTQQIPNIEAMRSEILRTVDSMPRVSNSFSDLENTQRELVIDEPGSVDTEKQSTVVNQAPSHQPTLFVPSISAPTVSTSAFFRGVHSWPISGRDVIPEIDLETAAVNVKNMIRKLEGEIKLNDGRISFDPISLKRVSPVYLTERTVLFRVGNNHSKEARLDESTREKRMGGRSPESEERFSDSKDTSEHEVEQGGRKNAFHPYIRLSSTDRPVLETPSVYWHDKKRDRTSI